KTLLAISILALGTTAMAADTGLSHGDKKFFEEAAAGGMFEVEVGKLADQKAQDPGVKAFGQTLVKDHSAANDELKALAGKKAVTLPTALPKDQQKKLDKLAKAKDFDKDFVKDVGLHDHKKDI